MIIQYDNVNDMVQYQLPCAGSRIVAWAEEDDVDDEMVDVEGEGDESSVTDEGIEEDGSQPSASPDADTTILFTKPIVTSTSGNFGKFVVEILTALL